MDPCIKAGLNSSFVKLVQMIKQKMKRVLIVQIQFLNLSLVELDLGKVKVNSGLRVIQTQVIFFNQCRKEADPI